GGAPADDLHQPAAQIAPDRRLRMYQEPDRQALTAELVDDRVDEEGHVIRDDLDHRLPGRPAVLVRSRGEHVDHSLARGADLGGGAVRERGAEQVTWLLREKVLGQDVVVVPLEEFLGLVRRWSAG